MTVCNAAAKVAAAGEDAAEVSWVSVPLTLRPCGGREALEAGGGEGAGLVGVDPAPVERHGPRLTSRPTAVRAAVASVPRCSAPQRPVPWAAIQRRLSAAVMTAIRALPPVSSKPALVSPMRSG